MGSLMDPNWHSQMIDILLVEDNPGDVRLTREVFKDGKLRNQLFVCGDGEEALEFLYQRGRHAAAPRPDIVLLDLNLSRKDGREVLAEVQAEPRLRTIPIVVLTTSDNDLDICRSYDLHANSYITKPVDLAQFVRVVSSI